MGDENYVNHVSLKIPVWIAEGEKDLTDNRSIWEWLKYNIRAHAIQYSIKRAQEINEKEKSLQTEYSRVSEIYENDSNDINSDRLNAAKERLELFCEEKVKGIIIIRARTRWHEHGERSTKYFLNLEKWNHVKKHMRKLNINDSMTADSSHHNLWTKSILPLKDYILAVMEMMTRKEFPDCAWWYFKIDWEAKTYVWREYSSQGLWAHAWEVLEQYSARKWRDSGRVL